MNNKSPFLLMIAVLALAIIGMFLTKGTPSLLLPPSLNSFVLKLLPRLLYRE